MKKAALVITVLLAISLPVFAQEFPDVPPDHWAYDAVQELVDAGVIQGYPDGTFGGKRAMSRYEFAEALAKAIPAIQEMIAAGMPGGVPGPAGPAGAAGPVGPPGAGAEEVAAIRKLVDEFRDELAALGVDVEALRRDVAALNERVTALEEEVARVRFTGEANLIATGEVLNTGAAFDVDSRPLAAGAAAGQENNPLANSSVFTDLQFGMKAKVSEDASLNALIAAGDYLKFALADQALADFVLWNLNMDGAVKLGPLGAAQVCVGRFPFQLTPLTLKFVDPDSYANVTKLDSGDYVLDGGTASFNLGKVALTAFAAKANPISDLISPDITGPTTDLEVSQIAGARAVIGTGLVGNLGLTYAQAATSPGRGEVFGADINTNIGSVGIAAEYAQSEPNGALNTSLGGGFDEDNTAWNAALSYQTGNLALKGGFSTIEKNFSTAGYWSRIGRAVNLTNVKGPSASLTYALSPRISLSAEGQFLEPDDNAFTVSGRTAINQGRVVSASVDKVTAWKAGIKYGLTAANSVDLGWEQVKWEPTTAGNSTEERYISIGIGHSFNPNASLKLLYQIVEYEAGGPTPYTTQATPDYRGGRAEAQFQLKY